LPDERWGESQPARSQIPRLVLSNEVDAKGNAHVNDTALKQLVAAAQAGDEKALEAKAADRNYLFALKESARSEGAGVDVKVIVAGGLRKGPK